MRRAWFFAVLALLALPFTQAATTADEGFVYTGGQGGHQLMLNGKPWYFMGANAYWVWDIANWRGTENVDLFFRYCNEYNLRVIRIWGYNHNSPKAAGVYDDYEMGNLDYLVMSAGKHNVRLMITLSNFWEAYRSPEELMALAGEQVEGKDILEYYRSEKVKTFLKGHFKDVVTRVNTLTGVAYNEDPTILAWTAMNEPRCPGCISGQDHADHMAFEKEMSQALKDLAPKQLVTAGTEGFFLNPDLVKWNPGAGVRCEGESWTEISNASSIDVLASHIYKRQMEWIPPTWRKPDFKDYLSWVYSYLNQHIDFAVSVGKPYIVEETNLILTTNTKAEQAQFFLLMTDWLRWQASIGGPFSGLMFWNAAIRDFAYDDGYNVYLDVPALPPPPPPQPSSPPPVYASQPELTPPSDEGGEPAGPEETVTEAPTAPPEPEPERKEIFENTETLDDFRRVAQRSACSQEEAKTWEPEWAKDWARERIDYEGYAQRAKGKRVQDIIKSVARSLG